jgi:beta-lactamase regulating signal transducer with metallopeptidase domain
VAAREAPTLTAAPAAARTWRQPSPRTLALLWLAPSAALLGAWAWRLVQVHRLCRAATPLESDGARAALGRARDTLGIDRPVELLVSESLRAPAVWGLWRQRLLAPSEARHWNQERWQAVLLHELAHVRRHDVVWQTLGDLACRVWWWHPAAWLASLQQRRAQELACDDLVLAAGLRPSDYAGELLSLASGLSWQRWATPGVAMVSRSEVGRRIAAILDPRGHELGSPAMRTVAALLMTLVCLTIWTAARRPPEAVAREGGGEDFAPAAWRSLPEPAEGIPRDTASRLSAALSESALEIERLRQRGRGEDADLAARRLAALRARLEPDHLPPTADQPELHVVAIGRGRPFDLDMTRAAVRVTHRGAPVALCLISHSPVRWELSLGLGARVTQVLLAGAEQSVAGVPPETVVTDGAAGGDKSLREVVQVRGYDGRVSLAARTALQTKTGLAPATIQWIDQAPRQPLVVGPDSETWRQEAVLSEAEAFRAELGRPARLAHWRSLREIEFVALDGASAAVPGFAAEARLMVCTLAGPTERVLARFAGGAARVRQAVWDERDQNVLAVLDRDEVALLDPVSGNVSPLLAARALPAGANGLMGLAFDTKRRMLFVATHGGGGRLLRCDLDRGRWLPPLGLDDLELALAYSPAADAVFGWQTTDQGGAALYRFDEGGAIVSRRELPEISTVGHGHRWQLAAAGNYLALLRQPEQWSPDHPRPRTQAYLVDPSSGRLVFTSQFPAGQR